MTDILIIFLYIYKVTNICQSYTNAVFNMCTHLFLLLRYLLLLCIINEGVSTRQLTAAGFSSLLYYLHTYVNKYVWELVGNNRPRCGYNVYNSGLPLARDFDINHLHGFSTRPIYIFWPFIYEHFELLTSVKIF